MFVIKQFFQDFKKREAEYNEKMKQWTSDNPYYGESHYRRKFGMSPKDKLAHYGTWAVYIVLGTIVAIYIVALVRIEVTQPPKPVKASAEYKNGEDCGTFKIGDIATVKSGDKQGAEVEIIGGCEDHTDYETKVTRDQTLFAEGSENENYDDLNIKKDLIIKIDSSDNLTKTGHIEKKE